MLTVENTGFGIKYVVRCVLTTPDGRDPCVLSVWIDDAVGRPRFVTAYPAGLS
ncbi:MAG: hypothetical protein JO209_00715 [Acidisphaera sp.]|nr:hypothetical protein [Acidisphaera sp.]